MLEWIDSARVELLFIAAVGIAVGGLGDMAIDLFWFVRNWWRKYRVYAIHPRATADSLDPPAQPGRIAILVGTWREAGVIGQMLETALARYDHPDYRIYVGTYPNDPATIDAVQAVARRDARIRIVIGNVDGPTTKGENLNRIWRHMVKDEQICGIRFKAIVIHDAEDVVHPAELRLFDRMIERFDAIQLPVLPLPHPTSPWVTGHYCDEFAEAHHRQMVVREAIGAALPFAGVGCAISRKAIEHIARIGGGVPFDPTSLTEDYELGLRLAELGYRIVMINLPDRKSGLPVATVAHFPFTVRDAVRQKRRWIAGIAMAGWDRLGWSGCWTELWMRARDRRTIFVPLILSAAYGALLLELLSFIGHRISGTTATPLSPVLQVLLGLCLLQLVWRLWLRAYSVRQFYGRTEALRSMPRIIVSNFIAIWAGFSALFFYLRHMSGRPLHWDKTDHIFPECR